MARQLLAFLAYWLSCSAAQKLGLMSNYSSDVTCIAAGSLGRCEKCIGSDQCGGNMHCCPFMKTCVRSSTERCYGAIAMCQPPCSESTSSSCHCQNKDFPRAWQKPSCSMPGESVVQPSTLLLKGDMIPAALTEHAPEECLSVGSLGLCEKCTNSDQCVGDLYCCPFMKTCVGSPSDKCSGSIAMCEPPCSESVNPSKCSCQNDKFPGAWQKPLCAPQVDMHESPVEHGHAVVVSNLSSAGSCIPSNSLGRCEKCISSEQCGESMFCCPFMKTCVGSPSEKCSSPIAMCEPPCSESANPSTCSCQNDKFPGAWQKPLCAPQVGMHESPDKQKRAAVISNLSSAGSCFPPNSLGRCEKCLRSEECSGNMHCCPFMKTCVRSSSEQCYGAIAMCQPPCAESEDPNSCRCQNNDFPSKWQKHMCPPSRLYVNWPLQLSMYRRHVSYLCVLLPGALVTSIALVRCMALRVSAGHVTATQDVEHNHLLLTNLA
eukprot:TRINITY_DN8752_c0_g1_i1.p1 TRINITY_DN8752_c0_g1~~TRINITY_DN8752_c0_g1_i1.p1  ORF type:complete len:506 (+),score=44.19 TRINITY_DN8752_c0_g1_i1:56-1519(+)